MILLIRRGLASVGAADYDVLTPIGRRQAEQVGTELDRRGATPTRFVSGTLRRQRDTAEIAARTVDRHHRLDRTSERNEFDRSKHIPSSGSTHPPACRAAPAGGRAQLDHAIPHWSSGLHNGKYAEPFPDFTHRIERTLRNLVDGISSGQTTVVVASAGVIAWVATASMNAGGAAVAITQPRRHQRQPHETGRRAPRRLPAHLERARTFRRDLRHLLLSTPTSTPTHTRRKQPSK